jgi:hypothetical protein
VNRLERSAGRRRPLALIGGLFATLWVALAGHPAGAADLDQEANQVCAKYVQSDAMVPMRDGIRLYTEIFEPKNHTGKMGVLLLRTPYEEIRPGRTCSQRLISMFTGYQDAPYIVVIQSVRGRYRSEGVFELLPPPASPGALPRTDQTTDAWDTVDWLVKHVPDGNGRVAMRGASYEAWLVLMAALNPHPAMVAGSVQASRMDQWIGDDFWRDGALRLDYAFEYAAFMELSPDLTPFDFSADDLFDWYVRLGPISRVNSAYFHRRSEFWNQLEVHRVHDAFWQSRTPASRLAQVRIPILVTAGWWDAEDFYGPLQVFKALSQGSASRPLAHLVVGPWTHGGWTHPPGRELGGLDFGSDTATHWLEKVEQPWLAHWALGAPDPGLPRITSFQTGANRWRGYDDWPKAPAAPHLALQLTCDGGLSAAAPPPGPCRKRYIADPAAPVPYLPRPIGPIHPSRDYGDGVYRSPWSDWEIQDQRFASRRPDTVLFETKALPRAVALTGEAELTVHIATTGSDGDFIVKLMDIYPDFMPQQPTLGGRQLLLDHAVIAARYRDDVTRPKPLIPGHVYELKFRFNANDHVFLPGHRIAIQVQSSLFPVLARNPQTFRENLFTAGPEAYRPARVDLVFGPRTPNRLVLPLGSAPND